MSKNRRLDHALRQEIDRLRKLVHTDSGLHQLYQSCLSALCRLEESPCGFVAILTDTVSHYDVAKWQIVSLSTGGQPQTDSQLPIDIPSSKLFETIERTCSAEIVDESLLAGLSHTLEKHASWPVLDQVILIPLIEKFNLVAVVGMANAPSAYSIDIFHRCWPLLTTAMGLRRLFLANHEGSGEPIQEVEEEAEDTNWRDIYAVMEKHCPVGMIELNENHKITRLNPFAEKLFMTTATAAVGLPLSRYIPERFPNEHKIHTFSSLPSLTRSRGAVQMVGQTDLGRSVAIEVTNIHYKKNHQTHFLLMITDRSTIQEIEEAQETQVQRFRAVSDLAPVGILQTDENWEAIYVNRRWCEICQREMDEISNMGWVSAFHHEDVSQTLTELREALVDGVEFKTQCRLQAHFGQIVWVELMAKPLYNMRGDITGFLATIIDCTYRELTEQKLRQLAELDTLTQLANRALLNDRLQQATVRTQRSGMLTLFSLDLDGFKNVNDTLGHDAGDQLLIQVGERLIRCVRESDTVARVGGDEFIILVEHSSDASIATEIAEKILECLDVPFKIDGQELYINTSIGITFYQKGETHDNKALLKQADIALYRAKSLGKNNYQYFSPELEAKSRDRLYLCNSLHRALERREFLVFYQLQASLTERRIVGSEALLRWQHPERGLLSPIEFIEILEESSIILSVSRWLWGVAFAQHQRWVNEGILGEDAHISINFSPRQLRDLDVVQQFRDALTLSGLTGSQVIIEITESVLLEESKITLIVLQEMRSMGVKIALDDFGTGYSSLSYLKRFPIDVIKIDRSFVRDLITDPEDAAITKALITLAHSLELNVVAEGVDSAEKQRKLEGWQCDMFQGFFLNRPMPGEQTHSVIVEYPEHENLL